MATAQSTVAAAAAPGPAAAVARVRTWYHTLELAPGVRTPGWFDLRPIAGLMPWPDVRGRRCLDVGAADGFFAFELERRGAAEVVACDIWSNGGWDFERHVGELGSRYMDELFGARPSSGFAVARELLGSRVTPLECSVYELSPEVAGEFDVVVCGSLLLHLRDPLRALAAIRTVCRGELLCTNQIDMLRSCLAPRRPLARLDGASGQTQWWLPNTAAHRQMLRVSGFVPRRASRPYAVPFGPGYPYHPRGLRGRASAVLPGGPGVPHYAVLAGAA
jgi:tRNA (mo5U34)-methyltransferase